MCPQSSLPRAPAVTSAPPASTQPVWPSQPSLHELESSGGVPPSNTKTFKPKLSKDHRFFYFDCEVNEDFANLYSILYYHL